MEVQRQPLDEPVGMESVLTSPTGITTMPETVQEAQPVPSDASEAVETSPPEPEQEAEPVAEQIDEIADSHGASSIEGTSLDQAQPASESNGGITDGAAESVGEPTGDPGGSSASSPPPSGGTMFGLGGRLVYPKTAESARGGPIEYSVTFDVLVSQTGTLLDITVTDSWFDRDLDEYTTSDLLRTAELMMQRLLTFTPYKSDYWVTVVLTFDAKEGPSVKSEAAIRPVSD